MHLTNKNNKIPITNISSSSDISLKNSSQNIQTNTDKSSSNSQITQINLSNEALENAYFLPQKLKNIYNYIYNQFQYQLYTNVPDKCNFYQANIRTFSNANKISSCHLNSSAFADKITEYMDARDCTTIYGETPKVSDLIANAKGV